MHETYNNSRVASTTCTYVFKPMLMQRMDMNIDDTTKKGMMLRESELKNSPISITFYGQPQLTRSTFFPIPSEFILPLPSPMNQLRRLKYDEKFPQLSRFSTVPDLNFFIGRRRGGS